MRQVHESTTVDMPVGVVYDEWTQFERFPDFMGGLESVTRLDNRHLLWVANIGGRRREWIAQITDQDPERRIGWRSISGMNVTGEIRFTPVTDARTIVEVHLTYEPESFFEHVAGRLAVDWQLTADLQRFKEMIEQRATPSPAWRSANSGDHAPPDAQ